MWTQRGGLAATSPLVVQAAVRLAATGEWTVPATISDRALFAGPPAVAVDAAGDVTVAWEVPPGPTGPGVLQGTT